MKKLIKISALEPEGRIHRVLASCRLLGILTTLLYAGSVVICHGQGAGSGDSVLHLGATGYASLPDSQFTGFDSSKDFSIEAALNIEANAAGGRWPIILGKKYSPPLSDPGFALGINQGQFKTVGQQVYAAVADGTNSASVTSRFFQGTVHAVMTWNSATKVLDLFINGALEGSKTNASINTAALNNNRDFKMGGASNYSHPLQRDLFFGRLWNRILRADEILAVWTSFNASSQHELPGGFDRTSLVSEWLMKEMNDSTHLKDTAGANHLQVQGSASLWNGSGSLTLQYPSDGATGISKSVMLRAGGGIGNLGPDVIQPLHYEFEVDEVDTFNSPNKRSSGWLAHYGAWKPRLKPNRQYFWRVRVRDSSSVPLISSFTDILSFTTKPSTDWYVRPGVYAIFDSNTGIPIPTSGIYGLQNGTSYPNAWNGLFSIQWGEGGVEPGDDLYVCGIHVYEVRNQNFTAIQAVNYITESGHSSEYPITIRMDSPFEAGAMWGAGINKLGGGGTWYGPDENGVYWSSNLLYSADYCLNGTNVELLDRATATTWQENLSASFKTNNVWYVKTPDGSSPAGKVLNSNMGYRFHLGRSSFIQFYKCKFRNASPMMENLGWNADSDTQTSMPLSTHIIFDGCDLRYNSEISPTPGHNYWTIRNCELSFSQYGIYTFANKRDYGAHFLTIQSNYIHDMGTKRFPHIDAHGVGIQGGEGHLIEGNRIEDTGSAIEFWTYSQPMRNHTIRYNFIKNIHVMPITGGAGIVISGDNTAAILGLRTGIKVYGNVIMNTGLGATESWQGIGIGSNCKDYIEIFNNTIYEARKGIQCAPNTVPVQAKILNNIIVNPTLSKFLNIIGNGTSSNLIIDHNLYFPVNSISSQLTVYPDVVTHSNSIFLDPLFVSNSPSQVADFRLLPESPAIDSGTPIGIFSDFAGTSIPQNTKPDIGAYEVYSSFKPMSAPKNPRAIIKQL